MRCPLIESNTYVLHQMSLEQFFGVWSQFLEDYKTEWKLEQKDIAKKMFEKVESQRKVCLESRYWGHVVVVVGSTLASDHCGPGF